VLLVKSKNMKKSRYVAAITALISRCVMSFISIIFYEVVFW